MRRLLLLVTITLGCSVVRAQEPAQSAKIVRAVSPVTSAIKREIAAQNALPAPASTRERLERMGRLDQAGRVQISEIDFTGLTPEDRVEVGRAIGRALAPVDKANLAELQKMLPEHGWFTIRDYGEDASGAAFHIVQHSDNMALKKQLLSRLQRLAEQGEIDGFDFAAMFDRVAIMEGRPQRYGTQFHCVAGKIEGYPLENIGQVEELRRPLNLPQTYAESLRRHAGTDCAGR